jgi:cytochrome P450
VMEELCGIDLTDLDNFSQGFPHHLFDIHRRESPVWWHEPTTHTPDGEGFWSIATYAHVLQVLSDPVTFSSETGGDRPYGGTILQDLPVAGVMLNMMDDPRHARIRRLVTRGLTPATVRSLEEGLRLRTRRLLAPLDGECDYLVDVAADLPMQAICMLLGIPEEDRHHLFRCVEHIFDLPDESDYMAMTPQREQATSELFEYGRALIDEKRRHPRDDMLSVVIHSTLPDEVPASLTEEELSAFFSLLFAAGAETTRNAVAGSLIAFLQNPDQLAAVRADEQLLGSATEEILRWTTPSPSKRRTATKEYDLGGHHVQPGDKVLVWEGSANRDAQHFTAADTFIVNRDPNPHLAFGHGAHFCLGAHLARIEIRVAISETLRAFETFELLDEPEWTRSNRHTGLRHLHLRMARRAE